MIKNSIFLLSFKIGRRIMKKRIMTVIITAMVVSTFLVGCDSTKSNYEKAVKYQEDQE